MCDGMDELVSALPLPDEADQGYGGTHIIKARGPVAV